MKAISLHCLTKPRDSGFPTVSSGLVEAAYDSRGLN